MLMEEAEFIAYPLSEGRFYLTEVEWVDADRRPVWINGVVAPCAPQELGSASESALAPLRVVAANSCDAWGFPVNTWASFMAWENGQVLSAMMTLSETLFVPLPFLSHGTVFEAVSRRLAAAPLRGEFTYEEWFTLPVDSAERYLIAEPPLQKCAL